MGAEAYELIRNVGQLMVSRGAAMSIFDGAQSVQFQPDSVLIVVANIAPQTDLQFIQAAELIEIEILRPQRPEEAFHCSNVRAVPLTRHVLRNDTLVKALTAPDHLICQP